MHLLEFYINSLLLCVLTTFAGYGCTWNEEQIIIFQFVAEQFEQTEHVRL